MARRSYDHFCAAARALDVIGDRWALLIVRELLAGRRRYTDLHADLPGISTDMLAARLKELEQDGVVTRRKLPPPGAATVYELTPRGRDLLPVLAALSAWGASELADRRPTDAVRAHWFAIPLIERLRECAPDLDGVVEIRLDEGVFHVHLGGPSYGDGAADDPDLRLTMSSETCRALVQGAITPAEAYDAGTLTVIGDGPLADAFRGKPDGHPPEDGVDRGTGTYGRPYGS
ncbi:DNA-binding HxlR family transcriptional regulator [Thermocatellispora tengchongensis]|uniref:DNA-binding HxlR family transcriptional regulator n=1 Tax=Thermocatellispora tengchongensis TaxID=1073253 RepID=A0A840P7T7_9ACTN|nr:winged helix-turn-helix transcriptional regulator [Thermocatellispora tengchongensis]MBB5137404.1 DNA-binding HxlR family transcriptional regulator [Thermocatellispora tengchongensis]